ncbi:MAG: FtsX-like permease family protein [Acidobacteriota bacterium]|nr:FtsX-like permease family protein [Acidobacteriota bacterium]
MGFVWHIAVRYFRSTRADAHIRALSTLTAGGLAVGTAALVLALSALAGFQNLLLEDLARHTPALQIEFGGGGAAGSGQEGAAMAESVQGLAELAAATNGVAAVQELLYARGWLADGDRPFAVEVLGYEKRPPPWIPVQPEATSGLIVPVSVALRMGLAVGDMVRVVSPRPGLTPVGPQPRTRMLPVDLIYRSERAEDADDPVLVPLEQASALFARGDRRLDLTLAPKADPERIGDFLRRGIDPSVATVTTWKEANRALLFVLRLEKGLVFSAVALIVAVASFALLAALSMVLSSKRAEVGVLAAMGAPPARLQRVFLLLGALLSVGGAGLGGAAGAGLAALLDRYRVISTPSDVYVVDYVPFLVRGTDVLVVVAVTVLFTAAAAVIGARKASLLHPVEAMRSART